VTANITHIGVTLYHQLYYIPGFVMFRSFNEKWFYVFAFFYSLLFAVSLYFLFLKKKLWVSTAVILVLIGISIYRMTPLLSGKEIQGIQYESNNVQMTYSIDPDLLDALSRTRGLPDNGNVLTLPLTIPSYQISYGKQGGAYVGISMVEGLAGNHDFPGLWAFGSYRSPLVDALSKNNSTQLLQILSLFNIRYVFRNADNRIMDNFPASPYISPKKGIPATEDQHAYDALLSTLPLSKIYQKGFYQLYQLDDLHVRPTMYIPDMVYSSPKTLLNSDSFRSAYIDPKLCAKSFCEANQPVPSIAFKKKSSAFFTFTINLKTQKTPFLLVLSTPYNASWSLTFQNTAGHIQSTHQLVNGYANGWIIDPSQVGTGSISGSLYLTNQNLVYIGAFISGLSFIGLVLLSVHEITWRRDAET
jgi:hypothetical protein